jgi:hypothetical protein
MRFIPCSDSDGHHPGDDRNVMPASAAVAEIEEIVVVEKQLGADVVRTFVDLGFEEIEFIHAVGGGRVAFGKAGHADAETARVRVFAGFVEFRG